MIIEGGLSPLPPVSKPKSYKLPLTLGLLFASLAAGLPLVFVFAGSLQPTGSLISPLPQGELADTFAPTTPPPLDFKQTINLSQNYLNKAYELARNPNQTDDDKRTIFNILNQSLKQATDSINLSPRNPAGYLVRAQVLTAISKIKPEALALARQDLDVADKLSQNQNVVLPPAINPLNLLPEEQAASLSAITIAAPNETNSTSSATPSSSSNASQKQIVLPANQTEVEIVDPLAGPNSFIYLIPAQTTNNPVFVKTKTTGRFVISTTQAISADQTIDYYIIND